MTMEEMKRMMKRRERPDPEQMLIGGSGGGSAVDRKEARRLIGDGPRSYSWKAWPRAVLTPR
jgi:hypothetical protein